MLIDPGWATLKSRLRYECRAIQTESMFHSRGGADAACLVNSLLLPLAVACLCSANDIDARTETWSFTTADLRAWRWESLEGLPVCPNQTNHKYHNINIQGLSYIFFSRYFLDIFVSSWYLNAIRTRLKNQNIRFFSRYFQNITIFCGNRTRSKLNSIYHDIVPNIMIFHWHPDAPFRYST